MKFSPSRLAFWRVAPRAIQTKFGGGQIIRTLRAGAYVPVRLRLAADRYSMQNVPALVSAVAGLYVHADVLQSVHCDFWNMLEFFERADALREKILAEKFPAEVAQFQNTEIKPSVAASFYALHGTIEEDMRGLDAQEITVKRNAFKESEKSVPLSELYKNKLMTCAEWSAVAAYWLRKQGHDAYFVSGLAGGCLPRKTQAHAVTALRQGMNPNVLLYDPANPTTCAPLEQSKKNYTVPGLYRVSLCDWARFDAMGDHIKKWLFAQSVWKNANSGGILHFGFDLIGCANIATQAKNATEMRLARGAG